MTTTEPVGGTAPVVVIGGGCTGLFVALELDARGVDVLVVEQHALGGGQTAHAHGWLHHGHIFTGVDATAAAQLRAGADRWRKLAAAHGVPLITEDNTVAFSDPAEAELFLGHWQALDGAQELDEVEDARMPGLRAFRSGEAALVPGDVLRRAVAGTGIRVLTGRVVGLVGSAGIEAVEVETATGRTIVGAGHVVIAAGVGTGPLLGAPPTLELRETFMLLIETAVPLPAAFAFPEQGALGLFAVRRVRGGAARYLVSSFMSWRPHADSGRAAEDLWLGATARVLGRLLPDVWNDPHASWGIYPAQKLEAVRDIALGVPQGAVVDIGHDNAVAVAPGKLTVAPLVADRVVETLRGVRIQRGPVAVPGSIPVDEARWSSEDCALTPMLRRDTLFRRS